MNRKMQKILSVLLTLCMLLTNAPFPALAAEGEDTGASITNGYYDAEGNWVTGGTGSATYDVDGTNVTLSKTATPVEGQPNVFDITLRVETSTTTTTNSYYNAGAVVLVIDVSGSMDYCAECGGESRHETSCKLNTSTSSYRGSAVRNDETRMNAAKIAAQNFLSNYAGDDPNATRMLAVVSFQSSASIRLQWVNVAGGAGYNSYDQANNAILGLSANGGTNLDDGLYNALNLLNQDAVSAISSKNVIALTDGAPTRSRTSGDGTRGSATINSHTAAQATNVKNTGATLYTVCFGVANDYTYTGGPTVGNFLSDSVASAGKAYNADNSSELYSAFAKITESITSGLTGSDWTATDPMTSMIDVTSAPGNFTGSGDNYTWTLGEATEVVVNGNTTTYIYTVTYRVTLDVQNVNFEEGTFFPTNGETYLNLTDGTQLAFPVPGVKGVLPRTDVSVTKVWDDADNQDNKRTESVTVVLKEGDRVIGEAVLNADNNWTYTWDGETYDLVEMSKGEYHVYVAEEKDVPHGYEVTPDDSQDGNFNLVVTNTHTVDKTDITVNKVWDDKNNQDGIRPATVTVNLLADGIVVATADLTASNGWTYTFAGFPVNREGKVGEAIVYTVEEANVPEGYTASVDGFTVTNSHTTAKTSVTVNKVWDDAENQDGKRPASVTVELYADGVATGKTLTISGGSWTGTFTDLDEYASGKKIVYTVVETAVPEYTTSYSEDTLTITNTHIPELTSVSGSKTWNDNNNQDGFRPASITINLLKNGAVIETKTVTANDNWSWSFTDLPKYEAGQLIKYSITENAVAEYSTSYNGYNVINTHTPEKLSVTVSKVWEDNNDQDGVRPADVTVELYANGTATGKTLVLSSGNNWTDSFADLDVYENGVRISYTVKENEVKEYTTQITGNQNIGYTVTNVHTPEVTSVSGAKTWVDNDDQDGVRPESITINLLKNGEIIDFKTVTAEDEWKWTFDNLPKYENGGELIKYTISEAPVEDYVTTYNGNNVTNTHAPEKTAVSVFKSWQDNNDQDGIRPNSITVKLLADGQDTGKTLVLSEGNNWKATFEDLDKFAAGQEIVYTVEEVSIAGYETTITGDQINGYTITNSHNPATVEVAGSKTWVDNDDQDGARPESITINLLKNGEVIDTKTVTEADGWAWSFTGLPKFENHGSEITYTITEAAVEGYTTTYNGYNVTNTHEIEKTAVSVTKSWQDKYDQDGIRPNDITVILLANGQDTGLTLVLNEGNKWTGTFTDLDKFEAGEEIDYTVAEVAVKGYETVISGDAANGYTITNSHNVETIAVSGSKTWKDNDNQDGFRPESITIHLKADGEIIDTVTVTEADGWAWSFDNLPKYKDHGTLIIYTVTEDAVDDYSTTYDGHNVINAHTPEQTSVTVSKQWIDSDDQDGIRPNDITVVLLANGQDTGLTLVLSDGNKWTGSFTELDKYEAGEVIVYTIEEIAVKGYDTVITGDQTTGFTVTNTHNPETVKVEGAKTWVDNNDQDGKRPESITINLLKNGQVLKTITVTEADGWAWSFTDLPKYENHGTLITYSVTEEAVDEYSTEYKGFDVVNTHTIEKTSVTVTKSWIDNDDQDGIRPNDITVKLLADGADTGLTLVLSDGNNWTGSFTELDKYAEGEEIVYSVEELTVAGYESVITGDQKAGYTITNSHNPETVEVSGSKTWDDNNNQDGKRPESITINLLKNGQIIDTITVTEADGWAWSFTNLPKYENHGTLITYSVTEEKVEEYSTSYNGYNVVNTHTPEQTSVTVSKSWVDNNDQDGIRPNDITVKLLANGEDTGLTLVLSDGNKWTGSFTELDVYENGQVIEYTVEEIAVDGYETVISGNQDSGYTITNSHTPEVVEVAGSKTWDDNNDQDGFRPESITINLLKDGVVIDTVTVTEADGWAWSFTNLPKYENHGTLISYSVTEEAVEDYTTTYNGYDVTNEHTPEKTSVTVSKAWVDNDDQDGIRPNDVTIVLLANGEETEYTLILSQGNSWTGSFTELDKYAEGEEIVYSVQELEVTGYTTVITGDQYTGYTVTNSHTPATKSIEGAKTWKDNDDQDGKRPESITINLLANGNIIETVEVTEADGWAWTFENLPVYENHGSEIIYSITENAVDEYSAEYDGYNVINTHTPEQISLSVVKAWLDNNDQDGIRPEKITVILLANGEETGEKLVLDADCNWTGSFTELDKYADGVEIEYTVDEITVEGYQTLVIGDMISGYIISNSHTPETISVSGTKTWDDNDNQDGVRPKSITVNLLANGQVIDTATVTEADNWSYSFENLPKYENGGVEIVYAITEDAVEGYTTTYDGYNITNSYTPAEISITVTKAWADSDNEDGLRPGKITITLYADGELTEQTLVLTADDKWTGSFVGLPKYANGVEIVYTVGEIAVEGYNTVIRGDATKGFVVTNSHTVIPQTGDERTPILWMLMMLASMSVVAYVYYDTKKKRSAN